MEYFQSKQCGCVCFVFSQGEVYSVPYDKKLSHIDKKAFPSVMCSQQALFFVCLKCIFFCVGKMHYSVGTVPSG